MTHGSSIVIIGAGHNGLVCAHTLAAAGHRVTVIDVSPTLGGFAADREFSPGFHASRGADLVDQFPDSLVRELQLETHGLRWAATRLGTSVIDAERSIRVTADGIEGVSASDAEAWRHHRSRFDRFARFTAGMLERPAPRFAMESRQDIWGLARTGIALRMLGRREMREFLRIAGMNVYDLATDLFDDPLLRLWLGWEGTLGANFGPRSPGTVLNLLCRRAGESRSIHGARIPVGGTPALMECLGRAAERAGAVVRLGCAVRRIRLANDRVVGVELADGEFVAADTVVSSLDPRTTFFGLVGAEHLDTGFVRRVDHHRARGITAKLHLALSGVPSLRAHGPGALQDRMIIGRNLDALERAFNASKYGEVSSEPVLDVTIPTLHDATLAPPGRHVLSATVQYAGFELRDGADAARKTLLDNALTVLESTLPNIRTLVTASELLLPSDLARENNIAGGHWHHGDLAFDQFWVVRPFPGAAQHSTPVDGLYLCGASTHSGGGLTGIPGTLAAQRILGSSK